MTEARTHSHGLFWIVIIFLVVFLALSFVINLGLIITVSAKAAPERRLAVDEYPELTEIWSYGGGSIKAARIFVNGAIMDDEDGGGFFSRQRNKIEEILMQIRKAKNDPDVKAIILEVNSPGGGITPSDEIYKELMDFKLSKKNGKIIVFMKSLAASGGYYVSMAGDYIIAEPTSMIGSIGVMIQTLNWKSLSDRIGITDITIKSGKNKDLLNPFQEASKEQQEMLQKMVDTMHRRFKEIVITGRRIDSVKLAEIADGRIFSSEEALANRLIDEIGYWPDVLKKVEHLFKGVPVKIIRYEKKPRFFDVFFEQMKDWSITSLLKSNQHPEILYQWK
jgi:protease IV